MGTGWATFEGLAGDNRPHAHHALQLALAMQGDVEARIANHGWVRARGLLIAPEVEHVLLPGPVRLLYVDRESSAGRGLSLLFLDDHRTLDASICASLNDAWPVRATEGAIGGVQTLLACLGVPGVSADARAGNASTTRLRALIAGLAQRDLQDLQQDRLAAEVALSPSRFAHCFKTETGLPLRPYRRWLRLRRAMELAARGSSLTEAAHAAGFADAAHLTRTMRRHFGVAPSEIVASLRRESTPGAS